MSYDPATSGVFYCLLLPLPTAAMTAEENVASDVQKKHRKQRTLNG